MSVKTGTRVLVAIVLIGFVLGAGLIVYSRFHVKGSRPWVLRKPGRVVYVNLDRLVKHHPAWSAAVGLGKGDAVAAAVRAVDSEIAAGRAMGKNVPATPPPGTWKPKLSRESVEADAIWNAVKSLDEWQNEQKSALEVRLTSSRKLMTNVATSEVLKQSQDIEAAEMDKRREVESRYLIDRLNGRMRVSALETAASIQGFESDEIKQSLEKARAQLALLLGAHNSELDAIRQDSLKQISEVRAQAKERVDSDLMAYELRQKRNINTRLATFRDEIVQEMGVFTGSPTPTAPTIDGEGHSSLPPVAVERQSSPPPLAGEGRRGVSNQPSVRVRETRPTAGKKNVLATTVGAVERESGRLRERVRSDIRRAVVQIAAGRGERAVFVREVGIPDRTSEFEKALKEKSWGALNPVQSLSGGS